MKKIKQKMAVGFDGRYYFPFVLAELSVFLAARLFIFGSINPILGAVMGIMAYSGAYFASVPFFLLGVIITSGFRYIHKFLIYGICMGTIHILYRNDKTFSMAKKSLMAGGCLLLADLIDLIVTELSVIKMIMYIGEVLMCMSGMCILDGSMEILFEDKSKIQKNEGAAGILTAISVAGAATFGEWSVVISPMTAFMYIRYLFAGRNILNAEEYGEYIKECVKSRLNDFAGAFERLSSAFTQLSETAVSAEGTANEAVDTIASKVCEGCDNYNYCWITNFYSTYSEIDELFSDFEKSGSISSVNMYGSLSVYCPRKDEICSSISNYSDFMNVNITWQKKNIESRDLISKQFKNVSELMNRLSENIIDNTFADTQATRAVNEALGERGIKTNGITVLKDKEGKREVIINMPPCYGLRKCTKKLIPTINECLDAKFVRSCNQCVTKNIGDQTVCTLKLYEKQRFRISWYASKEVKTGNQVSGDNYTMLSMSDGRFMAALSDAMGSGNSASMESAATVELFEDFVNAGFDRNMAVDMINSALVLKSEKESFSTLDSVIINLRNGTSEFIKICAAPTFIKRKNSADIIKSSSLPVGILPSADSHTSVRRLINNDVLVMVTDGVTDIIPPGEMKDFLAELDNANPRTVANAVTDEIKTRSGGVLNDDITVLAIRFWEREE